MADVVKFIEATSWLKIKIAGNMLVNQHVEPGQDLLELLGGHTPSLLDAEGDTVLVTKLTGCIQSGYQLVLGGITYPINVEKEKEGLTSLTRAAAQSDDACVCERFACVCELFVCLSCPVHSVWSGVCCVVCVGVEGGVFGCSNDHTRQYTTRPEFRPPPPRPSHCRPLNPHCRPLNPPQSSL
jgi:hypothetical protein